MKSRPKVLILKADGTNCDEELSFAFNLAGGNSKIVHINELRGKNENLKNYNILAIPGGFAYGDDIVSGKILAVELTSYLKEELKKFIDRKNTLIIGICNGFQVLIRTGILPFDTIGKMRATLTNNDSRHFECRWVNLKIEPNSRCAFLNSNGTMKQFNNNSISLQVAHGEGKLFADSETLKKIEQSNLVVFRYIDEKNKPTQKYPQNPNGSLNAIAGITDLTGRVLGLMPHPERFVRVEQHPNWRRMSIRQAQDLRPHGLPIFENMIRYIKNL